MSRTNISLFFSLNKNEIHIFIVLRRIEMTNDKIGHDVTSDTIVAVLNDRIKELESEIDATISAQEFGADMRMDVA